ncbi:extracellular solute-binding protein [Massilia oculi]|uniref:Extracellular solute-binding protein n=1 Tax=Massilia hydrophila TaxID=3044279 RepID=A0ABS7Y9I8_9BURK|nr:extracellular solute-binding protein [Massilia oculi]MCA1855652.1 extracellular solute-binding protein [Massilia oculi]
MFPFMLRLAGPAATLAAALLCTAPRACAQTELRMWTLLGGGDGARMAALVERFNASQREVRVTSTTLAWGEPFYTKLITSSVVGAGPDLAIVHLSRLPNLAGGGVLRPIAAAELRTAGLAPGDFYPRQWQKSLYAGRNYAVPLDLHPLVLYYNKALAGRAGLLDADGALKPLVGIDALGDAFRAVRQATGRPGLTMESSQSSYAVWRLWVSMLAQRNAPLIRDGRFAYGAAGADSLARVARWFQLGYAQPGLDYAASTGQFMGGQAGFMINGAWEVPELVRASRRGTLGFDYGIVPLPRMYGNDSVWGDSHAFALPANAGKPLPPHKLRAALRFVAFVSRNADAWAEGGHLPAYRPVAESPAVRALMPNRLYAGAARSVVYDPDGWYMGAAGPLEAMASKYLPAALSSQLTPAQALRLFDTEAARILARRAPRY